MIDRVMSSRFLSSVTCGDTERERECLSFVVCGVVRRRGLFAFLF